MTTGLTFWSKLNPNLIVRLRSITLCCVFKWFRLEEWFMHGEAFFLPPCAVYTFIPTEVGQSCWVTGWAARSRRHSAREGHRWGFLSLYCGVRNLILPLSVGCLCVAFAAVSHHVLLSFACPKFDLYFRLLIFLKIAYFFLKKILNIKSGTEGKYNPRSVVCLLALLEIWGLLKLQGTNWEVSVNSNHEGDALLFAPH